MHVECGGSYDGGYIFSCGGNDDGGNDGSGNDGNGYNGNGNDPSNDGHYTTVQDPAPVSNVLPFVYTPNDPQATMRLLALSDLPSVAPASGRPGLPLFDLAMILVGLISLMAGALFQVRSRRMS